VVVEESIDYLRSCGISLGAGLSDDDLTRVEDRFGFRFGSDHREFLSKVQPHGEGWYDWREENEDLLRSALDWPTDGVLFDVENNAFWPVSWGERPATVELRRVIASDQIANWPKLIPLYRHRYLPADPIGPSAPVFSVSQTDVTVYGDDLLDYVQHEFGGRKVASRLNAHTLTPWTLFAFNMELE
jgi:hypothetical protein